MRVLHIASGLGSWAYEMAKAHPTAHVTLLLLDYANVLTITKQNAIKLQVNMDQLEFGSRKCLFRRAQDWEENSLDVVHFRRHTTLVFLKKEVYLLLKPGYWQSDCCQNSVDPKRHVESAH